MIAKIDSCTTKFLQFARLRVGKAATIVKQVKEGGLKVKTKSDFKEKDILNSDGIQKKKKAKKDKYNRYIW